MLSLTQVLANSQRPKVGLCGFPICLLRPKRACCSRYSRKLHLSNESKSLWRNGRPWSNWKMLLYVLLNIPRPAFPHPRYGLGSREASTTNRALDLQWKYPTPFGGRTRRCSCTSIRSSGESRWSVCSKEGSSVPAKSRVGTLAETRTTAFLIRYRSNPEFASSGGEGSGRF